eukprot:1132045-Alexandrium_andersonii.AAC.1
MAQQSDQLRANVAHVDHSAAIRAHGSLSAAQPEETGRIVGAAPTEVDPGPKPEVPSLGLCCTAGAAGGPRHHSVRGAAGGPRQTRAHRSAAPRPSRRWRRDG